MQRRSGNLEIEHKTRMIFFEENKREGKKKESLRVEHHVFLRVELLLGQAFEKGYKLADAFPHKIPSLLELYYTPFSHGCVEDRGRKTNQFLEREKKAEAEVVAEDDDEVKAVEGVG